MLKKVALLACGIIILLTGRWFFYYSGFYRPSPASAPGYGEIIAAEAAATDFADSVSGEVKGTILIDAGHKNAFAPAEVNVLISRLISRGLGVRFSKDSDDLGKILLGKDGASKTVTPAKSPDGKEEPAPIAFIVICPESDFTKDEKQAVRDFLEKGGRLLLIADPTRGSQINSLALDYGFIFEDDYFYNMRENETNYRNVYFKDFKEGEITRDLRKIVLYTAGSITSAKSGVAFADENTFSSQIETRKKLSPIALNEKGNVLAVYDLTFMTEPHNGIADNNQLISNIANWLAGGAKGKPEEKTPAPETGGGAAD